MPIRLLLDEDVPVKVGAVLSSTGYDVIGARSYSLDKAGDRLPDGILLQEAIKEKRTVITVNGSDFKLLHDENRGHYGIIVYRHLSGVREQDMIEFAARLIDDFIRIWLRTHGVLNGRVFVMKQVDGAERVVCETPDAPLPSGI